MKHFYPWTKAEEKRVAKLNSPEKIQAFLDGCTYNTEGTPRVPRDVLRMKRAHCFDGALFAACVLAYHREPPLIIDLCAVRDDDHILTVFKRGRFFGAIAKSNYVGLRFREAIFRSPRELVLSYFESYFNLKREKTLREYSRPFDLRWAKLVGWNNADDLYDKITAQLIRQPHYSVASLAQIKKISRVDPRTFSAGLVGRAEKVR